MPASRSGWKTRKPNNAAAAARAREYASPEHRATRKAIQARLDAGHPVACWRCQGAIPNRPTAWHVGHDDHDRRIIRGAEHTRCNLRAAASKGARITNALRRTTSLRW